jgi:branched-chain amino acid transport system permease protein
MASGLIAETYRQDVAFYRGAWPRFGVAAVTAGAVVAPFLLSKLWQSVAVFALIASLAAIGLHVMTGLAGQVSLGHAAFVGIGAYTATWCGGDKRWPMLLWLPAAGVVAAAIAGIVAPFAARLRGLYLAVVTLAVVIVTGYVWTSWTSLSGGFNGRPTLEVGVFGHDLFTDLDLGVIALNSAQQFFFLCLVVVVVVATGVRNLQRTRLGRAFLAVRDRDVAAAVAGVAVVKTKVLAFMGAGFCAGLAGALLAAYQSYIRPEQFNLNLSIEYVAMVVIGGLGSLTGAICGAVFVTALPQLVRNLASFLPFISTEPGANGISADNLALLLYGLAIIVVLIAEPLGVFGLWTRFKQVWRTWPWSRV